MQCKILQKSSVTTLRSFMDTAIPEIRKAFNPSKILIFGSRIKGKAIEDSDIVVIIVSDFFREIKFVKRMASGAKKSNFPDMLILFVILLKNLSTFSNHLPW